MPQHPARLVLPARAGPGLSSSLSELYEVLASLASLSLLYVRLQSSDGGRGARSGAPILRRPCHCIAPGAGTFEDGARCDVIQGHYRVAVVDSTSRSENQARPTCARADVAAAGRWVSARAAVLELSQRTYGEARVLLGRWMRAVFLPRAVLRRCMADASAAAHTHAFGPHRLRASEVFVESRLSLGFVNLKPVVPGAGRFARSVALQFTAAQPLPAAFHVSPVCEESVR